MPDKRALRVISKYWQPRDQLYKQQVQQLPKAAGRQAECTPLPQNISASTFFCECVQATGSLSKVLIIPPGKVQHFQRHVLVLRKQLFPSWIFKPQFSKHPYTQMEMGNRDTRNVQAHFYCTELLFLSTKLFLIRLTREHWPAHSHLQNLYPEFKGVHRLPHHLPSS